MKTFLINVKNRRRRAEQFIQTRFYGLGGPDELSTSLRLCKLPSENSLQDHEKGIAMNAQLQESSSNRGYQQHLPSLPRTMQQSLDFIWDMFIMAKIKFYSLAIKRRDCRIASVVLWIEKSLEDLNTNKQIQCDLLHHISIYSLFSQGCLTHTCCKAWSCS